MTTNIFKPILFNTEMVQAILAGRKTQTRRVIKNEMTINVLGYMIEGGKRTDDFVQRNAQYKIGDILWVRETFAKPPLTAFGVPYIHKAGFDRTICGWKPSIHMPKEAARIFLKVTNVRCERLQDISEENAIAEGVEVGDPNKAICYKHYGKELTFLLFAKQSFQTLWDSINVKKQPWESNPWVWVYDFERIEKPENFI